MSCALDRPTTDFSAGDGCRFAPMSSIWYSVILPRHDGSHADEGHGTFSVGESSAGGRQKERSGRQKFDWIVWTTERCGGRPVGQSTPQYGDSRVAARRFAGVNVGRGGEAEKPNRLKRLSTHLVCQGLCLCAASFVCGFVCHLHSSAAQLGGSARRRSAAARFGGSARRSSSTARSVAR